MLCLQELQKPAASCSVPEPARTLALMELRGLHGVHDSIQATFTGSAWGLAGGECAHLMRDLHRYSWQQKRQDPPAADLVAATRAAPAPVRHLSLDCCRPVDPPEHDKLAAKRMADWVERFDEDEGFKAALRTVASICARTASGVEQCVVA